MGDVMVRGHLGYSNHKIIELLILGEVRRRVSRAATLADSDLFRSLVDKLPWKAVLKSKGVQGVWTFFKKIPQVWEQAIPTCQKMSGERRLAFLNREI